MAVDIQGKGGGGMAQVPLYGLDVVPGADRGYGVGMSQIMEPGIWTANTFDHGLIFTVD